MKRLKIDIPTHILDMVNVFVAELESRGIAASIDEVYCICSLCNWCFPYEYDEYDKKNIKDTVNYILNTSGTKVI